MDFGLGGYADDDDNWTPGDKRRPRQSNLNASKQLQRIPHELELLPGIQV